MSYARQVEIASGGKNGSDFELVDNRDGNGVQIIPLMTGFVIPTTGKINAARARADADVAEINTARTNVKGRPTGSSPAQLNARLTNLEALIADLL